jgi:hypothetical protein
MLAKGKILLFLVILGCIIAAGTLRLTSTPMLQANIRVIQTSNSKAQL